MACQIILIDRGGDMKEKKTKNIDSLYKVCNYRNDNHFGKQTTWSVKLNKRELEIQLWAKIEGKAGTENKYDFPPPVDNSLYFGICCLVCYEDKCLINMPITTWKQIYEQLFGGFEDLGESDGELSVDSIEDHITTKQGYSKDDGFIVSDDEELIEDTFSDTDTENED